MEMIGYIVAALLIFTFGIPFGIAALFIALSALGIASTMLYQWVLKLFRS